MNKNVRWLSAIALAIGVNHAATACGCTDKAASKEQAKNPVSEQNLTRNHHEKIIGVKN